VRGDADEQRRARRAFIAAHHPDRGGDAEAFRRGLAALDAVAAQPAPAPGRPAPVTVVRGGPLRSVVRSLQRRRQRRRAPRVR